MSIHTSTEISALTLFSIFLGFFATLFFYYFILSISKKEKITLLAISGFFASIIMAIMTIEDLLCDTYFSFLLFGFIWEMILLALAVAKKVESSNTTKDDLSLHNETQNKMLYLQSRYASLGETVGNIAHQWKQPLNAIGAIQNSVKAALIFQGSIPKDKLLESVETSFKLVQHLAETIDTFYSFLTPKYDVNSNFNVHDVFETIRKMTEYSFENSKIKLSFKSDSNPTIQGDANEFTHALLNLILNAKDAFDDSQIDTPTITVEITGKGNTCIITVSDNAGGVKIKPIQQIFDWHISSKHNSSGVGLYITKNIIEKRFGGTISVENQNDGAHFQIEVPYAEYGEHFTDTDIEEKLSLKRIKQLSQKIIELKELEKDLIKWADIFKHARWGIALHVGKSDLFETTNPAFNALYGYTVEELRSLRVEELFAPMSLHILPKIQEETFEKGYVTFEAVHKRKDGSYFQVMVELIVVKDDNGEVLYHMANIRDITEQKKANAKLLLKKFALENINEAIYLADKDSNFHYVNEGACRSLGYTNDELLQLSIGDVDPDWPRKKWSEQWNFLKEQKTVTMELHHKRKDGTLFPVEVVANYFIYEEIPYIMGFARDITERKEMEKRKEDERMRLFFERQLVGMAITSPEKGWLQANDKLCEMLGYSREELVKMTWTELTHSEDLVPDIEQFNRLLRGEIEDYMLEKRFIRKDGEILYTNFAVSCVRREDKSVEYVLALLEDITKRKQMENALRKNELFLSDAQRVSHVGSWELDIVSDTLSWSDETYRIFELDKDAVNDLHKTFYEYVHPDDKEAVSGLYEESLKTKLPYEVDHRIVMPDGRIKYVTERCETTYADDGIPLYSIGTVHDVTERKKVEETIRNLNLTLETKVIERTAELSKKEQEFRSLAENMPDFLVRYDKEGYRTYVNSSLTEYFGVSAEELLGTTPTSNPLVAIPHMLQKKVHYVLKTGEMTEMEISDDRTGKQVWWNLIFAPEFDETGEVIGVISIGRDITAMKEAEIELKEREEKFYNLFRLSPAAVSITSLERNMYLEVNESFLYHTKYSREEVEGHSSAELGVFANPEDRAKFFEKVMQDGVISGFEYAFKAKDGTIGYAIAYASMISLKGERCLLSHSYDLTERNIALMLLKESEKELKLLGTAINSTTDAVYIMDKTLSIIYVNDGACNMLGYTRDELTSMKMYEIDALHLADDISNIRQKAVNEGQVALETKHKRKYGQIIDVEIIGSSFIFNNKQIELAVVTDITERKKAFLQLQESKQRYQEIFENTSDSIYLMEVTKDGRFRNLDANPAFERSIGIPREVLIGTYVGDLSDEETTATVIAKYRRCVEVGIPTQEIAELNLPVGKRKFHSTLIPIKDETGRVHRIIGLAKDITDINS